MQRAQLQKGEGKKNEGTAFDTSHQLLALTPTRPVESSAVLATTSKLKKQSIEALSLHLYLVTSARSSAWPCRVCVAKRWLRPRTQGSNLRIGIKLL